jgi:dynein light intermediate chain 1
MLIINHLTELQDREANRTNEPGSPPPTTQEAGKMDNEKLMSFFSGLLNKGPTSGSPRGA